MSSVGLTPLPPHIQHSTTRLTHLQAHTLLSTFLERAENDAAYRPDSTLTERGPQALSSGSTPNLTLSHLKRILKGIEGKRVGGGLKGLGEEGNEEGEIVNGEEEVEGVGEIDGDSPAVIEDIEMETETPKQQQKKGKKRPLESDLDLSQQTPKPKKQKQAQRVLAIPNVERTGDPTSGAVITAPSDVDDWQDPDSFALAQNEVTTNDAAQSDTLGQDDQEFQDFDAEKEIEEDRNPSAGLSQPHTAKEEKDLVSIRLEGTSEVVDPRETPKSAKSKKKDKKEKRKRPSTDEQTPVPEKSTPDIEKSEKQKKKKRSKNKDSDVPIPSSPPPQATQAAEVETIEKKKKKKSVPQAPSSDVPVASSPPTQNSPALSKADRKKLKKARHMESKKDREEDRIRKKGH